MKLSRRGLYSYCLAASESPTFFNIIKYLEKENWKKTNFQFFSNFNTTHFQLDPQICECLEYKHLLAELIASECSKIAPTTYVINDENWLNLLEKLSVVKCFPWILKPSLLNNGQSIQLFSTLEAVATYYGQNKRLGGEHVLQQYILNPHLLRGHKYSIRVFLVLTNYDGAFLYPYGYLNIARQAYSLDLTDKRRHLTNEHLYINESNVIQIPSEKFDFFPNIFLEIQKITQDLIAILERKYPGAFHGNRKRSLEIFGLDFLVDESKKVWFLEANQRPCFPVEEEHPLQKYLYHRLWQDFIASFVLPIADNSPIGQIAYQTFLKIR